MYPWLWFWAPQLHFPLSGSLAQNIEPNTSWFSDLIKAPAGDANIERRAFAVASYGKQLGLITDVLLEVAKTVPIHTAEASQALASLRAIQRAIESIKDAEHEASAGRLVSELTALREHGGPAYDQVAKQLRRLLVEPTPRRASKRPRGPRSA